MARIMLLFFSVVCLMFLNTTPAQLAAQTDKVVAGPFSTAQAGAFPGGWEQKDLKGKVSYKVIDEKGIAALQADSKAAASGIFRNVDIDPKRFPIASWQWKISRLPANGDEYKKNGDDCAARVFVIFQDPLPNASAYSKLKHKVATTFSNFVPAGVAICYVWSNKLPKDQAVESPFTDWVQVIAVEQGGERVNQWVGAQRNVLEDFKRLFGSEPKKIVGIAIMTDSDQTGESLTSFYRDIVFKAN